MRRAVVAGLLACSTLTAACGSSDAGGDSTTLTVFAAASLTSTFTALGKEFEADHHGTTVTFSFGGSSDLAEQVQQGAPADVIATADTASMDELGEDAVDPRDFASNTLEIAVPPGNPARVTSLQDLARPGLRLVICAPEVPCGAATATVSKDSGVRLEPVSEEQSVTDVLGKVSSGEADAGVVYVTDVKSAGDRVEGVTFPESARTVNTYPIATIRGSEHADAARRFVDFILSDDGQQVLADAGFGKP